MSFIQILSNSLNKVGKTNLINNFNMKLVEPIDAENQDRYIVPLSVSYPLTSVNIREKDFSFSVKFIFSNFINPVSDVFTATSGVPGQGDIMTDHELSFETDKITIPTGIYTCKTVIAYMNNWLEEYNISLEKLESNKIAIHMSLDFQYWYIQTGTAGTNSFNGQKKNIFQQSHTPTVGSMQISFLLSDKLKFLLGEFNDLGPHYSNTTKSKSLWTRAITSHTLTSKYMGDASVGVNKMFFYCDEVQKSIVGDSKSSLLCTVPLKITGQGNAELETYTPPFTQRKLIKSIIRDFNIQVRDNEGVLIPFDSGSINIECQII